MSFEGGNLKTSLDIQMSQLVEKVASITSRERGKNLGFLVPNHCSLLVLLKRPFKMFFRIIFQIVYSRDKVSINHILTNSNYRKKFSTKLPFISPQYLET